MWQLSLVPRRVWPLTQQGNVYIADSRNNAIRKLALDNTVSTYATGFYEPAGVAVGSEGPSLCSGYPQPYYQSHRIKRGGEPRCRKEGGISGGEDGFAGGATFNGPRALLWVGGETGLLVSDSGNDANSTGLFQERGWMES